MSFSALPRLSFKNESINSHAYNIKRFSEALAFSECHLSLSQARDLAAICFSFPNANALNQWLKAQEHDFAELKVNRSTQAYMVHYLKDALQPLLIMSYSSTAVDHPFSSFFDEEGEESKTCLEHCQYAWRDWHTSFADFILDYMEATHNQFGFYYGLDMVGVFPVKPNETMLKGYESSENHFLESMILNHLNTQHGGKNKYTPVYETLKHKKERIKAEIQHCHTWTYSVSPELYKYIAEHGSSMGIFQNERIDPQHDLIIDYDKSKQLLKLNINTYQSEINQKAWIRKPINHRDSDFLMMPYDSIHKLSKNIFQNPFSFKVIKPDTPSFFDELEIDEIQFDQSDFKLAYTVQSFLIDRLKAHGRNVYTTAHEFLFDLPDEAYQITDVTPSSFTVHEQLSGNLMFVKPLTSHTRRTYIKNKFQTVHPQVSLSMRFNLFARFKFTFEDDKIKIEAIKPKIKTGTLKNKLPIELSIEEYLPDDDHYILYEESNIHLPVSFVQNKKGFRKALDESFIINNFIQTIQKNYIGDAYRVLINSQPTQDQTA